MASRHPHRSCKGCGKPREAELGGLLSKTGLCFDCGTLRREENVNQLAAREGPYYEHFIRRRFMAAYARVLQLEKAS